MENNKKQLTDLGEIRFASKPRCCFGFIQVPSDFRLEIEAADLFRQIPDVIWRVQKMDFNDTVDSSLEDKPNKDMNKMITSELFEKNKEKIRQAAASFHPKRANSFGSVDVMALACTSMSFTLGSAEVMRQIRAGSSSARVATNMATAVRKALHAIAVEKVKSKQIKFTDGSKAACTLRILMLTPYVDELHEKNLDFVQKVIYDQPITGAPNVSVIFEVVHSENLRLPSDEFTSAVEPDWIVKKIKQMARAYEQQVSSEMNDNRSQNRCSWNVVFIGCSAFQSTGYGFIDRCEQELASGYFGDEQPFVVTSTQATLWHVLHESESIPKEEINNLKGYGQLFSLEHF